MRPALTHSPEEKSRIREKNTTWIGTAEGATKERSEQCGDFFRRTLQAQAEAKRRRSPLLLSEGNSRLRVRWRTGIAAQGKQLGGSIGEWDPERRADVGRGQGGAECRRSSAMPNQGTASGNKSDLYDCSLEKECDSTASRSQSVQGALQVIRIHALEL